MCYPTVILRRLLFGLVAPLALAVPARASAASPADVAAADALFREARLAAKRGDYATACPKFRESYRLDPTVGTLLNTADCEEHDGRLVESLERFEEAFGRLAPSDDRVTYVRSRIHALEERVPRIAGTPEPPAEYLRVLLDGADVTARRPFALRVDPGPHEIHVLGPERDERLSFVLKEGERKDIDFTRSILPPPAPPARTPDDGRSASASNRTIGLVLGGVGVAALAATGVSVALMFHDKKTADTHCVGSECDQTGIDATASGKRFGTIGGATFAVSAVALAVGAFFFFSGRGPTKPTKDRTAVSLGPSVTPGGGGLVLGGAL
jgi:hypothetical protein